jgi:hypothetical protein
VLEAYHNLQGLRQLRHPRCAARVGQELQRVVAFFAADGKAHRQEAALYILLMHK